MTGFVGPRLVDFVRELILKEDLSISQMSRKLGVNEPWLRSFLNNTIESPSADRAQQIYEILTASPLLRKEDAPTS